MPQHVQVGNDVLEFPDGMPDHEIAAAIDKEYGNKATAQPQFEPTEAAPAELKPDQGLGLAYGLKHPIDNLGIWLDKVPVVGDAMRGISHATGMPTGQEAADATKRSIDQAAAEGRRPGLGGEIPGNVLASVPIMAVTRNPWLTGAMMGAANTEHPNDAAGVAMDAAAGGVFGKAGDVAGKMIGGVISPRINPMVRQLLDKGVKLTPGQVLQGMPHRIEDAVRSIYGVGDMVVGAQKTAEKSLNRVAAQEVVNPIGHVIPDHIPEGHEMVAHVGKALSDGYNSVIDDIDHVFTQPRIGNGPAHPGVRLDQQFAQELHSLRSLTQGFGTNERNTFETIVKEKVAHIFNPQTGIASGRALKDLDSYLKTEARDFAKSADPYHRKLADAITELKSGLMDMVGRQYPQHARTLAALNEGWSKLIRLEAAAGPAKGGVTSPEGLRQAALQKSAGMKNKATSRGQAIMQDLGDKASRVMSQTIPDSGTAARVLATGLGGAALFGGTDRKGLNINPWAAAAIGALALPYAGPRAGNITRAILASRPGWAPAARKAVERVARPLLTSTAATAPSRSH